MSGKRQDETGLDVKVTSFGGRLWGIRILRHGKVIRETSVDNKRLIAPCIADELRMFNKCGDPSPMADAARHRKYKKSSSPDFMFLFRRYGADWDRVENEVDLIFV